MVFLDIKKAFYLVDHDILLKKLAIDLLKKKAVIMFSTIFLNHIFVIKRVASYSMALTPPKSQQTMV